ncbi:MAG TPA: tRNA (N6-isopentenyl adenosine(37)-C2)-methylthiotransferase MiaB [Deltaproteobacteria bacterium]|nr:tRNA (N6-isopentenyl adenosine(37)-C2)-methylthiotransferase MiaB [Deltaproteobacteria bacterium]
MTKKYYLKTYGCQMNELDASQMGRLLARSGYTSTETPEEASVILINTCSIREKASQKVYSDVGRFRALKLKHPEIVLGVTGCQAQAEGRHLQQRFPYLDLVVGPDHTARLPELVAKVQSEGGQHLAETRLESRENYRFLNLLPDETENAVKAFVTIMKGCDNFCSFCIVPFVRGREVCRDSGEIIAEVQGLARRGVKEVTLLGQNVNSYGVGRHSRDPGAISFARLLGRLAAETDIERIRFTTSHPKDLSEELIEEFRRNSKLALHFHLPVQSGSDAVLERMYRGYGRREYLDKLAKLREAAPQLAVSSDIIVGFPGESEAEFEETMDLLREVRYDAIYSFVYSPRPKTTAALYFADDVPLEIKQERLSRLQQLQNGITLENNQTQTGRVLEVLVEGPSRQGETYTGRSSQNHAVHFAGEESDVGSIRRIKITHAGPNSLLGEKYE